MTPLLARIDWTRSDATVHPLEGPDLQLTGVRLLLVRNTRTRQWEARLSDLSGELALMTVTGAEQNRTQARLWDAAGEVWEVQNQGCGCFS